jgi:hypothetical protein
VAEQNTVAGGQAAIILFSFYNDTTYFEFKSARYRTGWLDKMIRIPSAGWSPCHKGIESRRIRHCCVESVSMFIIRASEFTCDIVGTKEVVFDGEPIAIPVRVTR